MGVQSRYDDLQGMEYYSPESKAIREVDEGAAEMYGHDWAICALSFEFYAEQIDAVFGPGTSEGAAEAQAEFQTALKKSGNPVKAAKAAGYL
jgi:hypothetical protein